MVSNSVSFYPSGDEHAMSTHVEVFVIPFDEIDRTVLFLPFARFGPRSTVPPFLSSYFHSLIQRLVLFRLSVTIPLNSLT
jgi:hypothetical protein